MGAIAIVNLIEMAFGMLAQCAGELKDSGVIPADHPMHQAVLDLGHSLPDAKVKAAA